MPLTKIQSLGITDGTIVNADINASAAITSGKLSGVPAETQSSFTTTISYNATLTATSANATVTKTAYYTKTGNIVVVSFPNITTTNTFSSTSVLVFSLSLPFTSNANNTTIGNVFGYNLKGNGIHRKTTSCRKLCKARHYYNIRYSYI
jgi:hypothetical protein